MCYTSQTLNSASFLFRNANDCRAISMCFKSSLWESCQTNAPVAVIFSKECFLSIIFKTEMKKCSELIYW